MSFSVSWLCLTNVTTTASVELLLIYVGLPSETHPVKCLGCFQAALGKASLAGGKLTMVLRVVPSLSTGPIWPCPLSAEKPQGVPNSCTGAPLPSQPHGSQGMAAADTELTCSRSSGAFTHPVYRGGMLEVLNNERKLPWAQNPSTQQPELPALWRLLPAVGAAACLCSWVWCSPRLKHQALRLTSKTENSFTVKVLHLF